MTPQKFRLIDLLVEESTIKSSREYSHEITSATFTLEYLSKVDTQARLDAIARGEDEPEEFENYLNGPWSRPFRVTTPLSLTLSKVYERILANFKKICKEANYNKWGSSLGFNLEYNFATSSKKYKQWKIGLPPGGAIYSHNPLMLDLLGISKVLQKEAPGNVVYVHNPSDSKRLTIHGIRIPTVFLKVNTKMFLKYNLVDQQKYELNDIKNTFSPQWVDNDRPTDLMFALSSSTSPQTYNVRVPEGRMGVNDLSTVREMMLPILRQFLSSRSLPIDLLDIEVDEDGALKLYKNQDHGIEGGIRINGTLDNIPQEMSYNEYYSAPFLLVDETTEEKKNGIISLKNEEPDGTLHQLSLIHI